MKSKKGMFFTLIAITLLSIVAISLTIISLSSERTSIEKRVGTLNDYVFSIEKDLPRKLYIAGFRIIFIYEKRLLEEGDYLGDINNLLEETFFNGTINGTASTDETQLLSGVLYSDIETDLKDAAAKVNLNFNISNPEIDISQEDPWNVKITLNMDIFLEDKGGLASWNRSASLFTFIPIENFEDPFYLINTNGIISHKIRESPYIQFKSGPDITNLTYHVNGSYYYENSGSPSFLDRLEGNFTSSPNGIESFVYLPDFINNGIPVSDKTLVDYIYFSAADPTNWRITGMPSWFKIDGPHITKYNLTGLEY